MAKLFGRKYSKEEILQRVGDMWQLAGTRLYELRDGSEKGVAAIDFKTGTGFRFTVLPDRGMDISSVDYCGRSLCWRSSTGDTSPAFYEPEGLNWLRGFFGGLVTTCGLTYCGAPCEDGDVELGLHGRVSNTPAKNVSVDSIWDGDDYIMSARGKVIETSVFGDSLCMTRKISAKLGENRLYIHDVVENIGFSPAPHMFLYHINIGFPIVEKGSELLAPSLTITPRDEDAEKGKEKYAVFDAPTKGYAEKVYFHDLGTDANGYSYSAIINRKCEGGFGVYVKFLKSELPRFTEWKMMGQGVYTVGLEPANCGVEGRAKERERGTLVTLEPGETREYNVEIGALTSSTEIAEIERKVKRIVGRRKVKFLKNER